MTPTATPSSISLQLPSGLVPACRGDVRNHSTGKPFERSAAPFTLFFGKETGRNPLQLDDVCVVFESHIGLPELIIDGDDPSLAVVQHAVGVKPFVHQRLARLASNDFCSGVSRSSVK